MMKEKLWNANYIKVMTTNFLLYFAFYLLTPLLPLYLSENFGATKDVIGIVLSGYTVAALIIRPFSGYVVDSFSRKKVLMVCLSAFAIFFAGYIAASTILMFAICRTLHGGPFGAVTVANSTCAIDVLPASRRNEGIGLYGLSNNFAMAIAPSIGIYLHNAVDSYMILFWIAFIVAIASVVIAGTIRLPEKEIVKNKEKLSLDRFFLTRAWLLAINIAMFGFCWGVLSNYLAIYSKEARVQLRKVLDDFKPDVCHLNNFNYQLTPSIILEIVKWRKETGRDCKIIFTAHDYQLVCPNHMLNNPNTHQNCEKCLGGHFVNCMKGKCIHGSTAKSAIGMMEAEFWKWKGTYKYIDTMICCSEFMKSKMDSNPLFATKTVAMHNFIDKVDWKETEKKDYVLYFGRFSEEKGIGTLIKVCKELPDVQFIFAGTGPLEETVNGIKNIKNVGFQKGEALEKLIREARFSIYPSEWYENCPFSVMESQMYGTPVLGADIGGIPELIQVGKTGELFESGNGEDLKKKVEKLWGDKKLCAEYSANCKDISFDTIDEYYEKIMKVYQ